MEIFYVDADKFKKNHNFHTLKKYADIELKTEKRFYEYTIGRYLVKTAAKDFFNIKDSEIIVTEYGKPVFKNSDINFSISHSKNIVIACLDTNPCGIDIEYIKQRDLNKLSKFFKTEFNNLNDFYKFWTLKEAVYKLGKSPNYKYNTSFNNYCLTIVSDNEIINPKITEIK